MATSVLLRALRRRDLPSSTLAARGYLPACACDSWVISTLGQKFASLARPFSSKRPFRYNIIGIDLGTTYSRVAVLGEKNAKVIENCEGSRAMPSMVAIEQEYETLVGTLAKHKAVTNPTKTFFWIKRLIGLRFDDPQTQKIMKLVPYKILKTSHNSNIGLEGYGIGPYSPEGILSIIVTEMKEAAESYLGTRVRGAIITVPAYFNDAQRKEIKQNFPSELDFMSIIDEPTAAALSYNYGINNKEGLIAVFDLGGATFDVSILKISNGVFEIKAMNGDTWLGGEDFDNVVVEYLVSEFKRTEGIDLNLKDDRLALHKLREAAEEAKIQLSSKFETEIHLPLIAAGKDMNITLTRSKFESLVNHLIEKIRMPCESCLRDAGISSTHELDEVLLVGGMARVPKVQEVVSEIFGKKISDGVIHPEEALALGAVKGQLLLNFNPLSLGIECWGGTFTGIIDRNAILPTKSSDVFPYPIIENHVRVFQGERQMASDNKLLAEFEIGGILPATPKIWDTQVEVTFDIDANGVLTVSAKHLKASGRGKKIQITIPSSCRELSEDVIKEMVKEGELHEESDTDMWDLIDAKKRVETLLYLEEAAFSRYKDKVPAEAVTKMEALLDDLRNLMGKDNSDEIDKKRWDVCEAINDFKFKFCKEELPERRVKDMELQAQKDMEIRNPIEMKKEAEAYLYWEEKAFNAGRYREKVPPSVARDMECYLDDLREALGKYSYYEIRKKYLDACDAFAGFRIDLNKKEVNRVLD